MLLHVGFEVEARHVLGPAHVTYEPLVIKMDGSDVPSHVFVGFECSAAVVAGIVTVFTVSAYMVLVGPLVVVGLLAHLADKAPLVSVDDQVVAVGLCSLESLVAVGTHVAALVGVHLHVALEILLGGRLIHTLGALVAARGTMLEHAVHVETDLLCEHFAAVITLVFSVPGRDAKVHVVEVLVKLLLSAEHQATVTAGVSLSDPSGVTFLPPPST